MSEFCTNKNDICFTDLPLFTVLFHWFRANRTLADINIAAVVYFFFAFVILWTFIKIGYRIIRVLIRPFVIISILLIVLYTSTFSYSEDAGSFVVNLTSNFFAVIKRILDGVSRIVFNPEGGISRNEF